MVEVNQDVLCDFCEGHFEGMSRDLCEGSRCGEATELYLEDNGIEEDTGKTFADLSIGDIVYFLDERKVSPTVVERKINSINLNEKKNLVFHADPGGYMLTVEAEEKKENKLGNHFIYNKECKAKLKELCIARIIELSEIIGDCK